MTTLFILLYIDINTISRQDDLSIIWLILWVSFVKLEMAPADFEFCIKIWVSG
jgi:hypothetical protein